MDTRANYKPTTLYREPARPWRRLAQLAALVALVTAGGFAIGFIGHALADGLGWVQ